MGWIRRQYEDIKGNLKWAILAPVWTAIVWVAHHLIAMFHLPTVVIWIVVLLVSCVMFYLVAKWQTNPQVNKQSSLAPTPDSIGAFDSLEKFFENYSTPLVPETEVNVRARADKYKAGTERENFLITTMARFIAVTVFEQVWTLIYGSQIKALEHVNRQAVKIDSLKQFYDIGLKEEPKLYGNGAYSFTSWLAFLKSWKLILEQGDMLVITVRGKEFLKYLIHVGWSANQRRG